MPSPAPESPPLPVRLDPDARPRLLVLIDVEEEFDWSRDFDRRATSVTHLGDLEEALDLLASFGIVPVGVCSHPVVADSGSAAMLRSFVASGRLSVGAHLHPWVCPPLEEDVTRHNSFPGNLPPDLEAAKLRTLTEAIEGAVGVRPTVYQAGRYGIGPHTERILEEQGYAVDMSSCPPFDFRDEGGPDFTRAGNDPYWFGRERPLLGLPVTGAFVGSARRSAGLYQLATRAGLRWAHLPALLARLGLVERMRLSPEGHSLEDLLRLTASLHAEGLRVFTLSFHSPSLKPGCTEYVRTAEEREQFLARMRGFCQHFMGALKGEPAQPLALQAELLASHPPDPTPSRP